jgi:hypothetical protein
MNEQLIPYIYWFIGIYIVVSIGNALIDSRAEAKLEKRIKDLEDKVQNIERGQP